MLGQWVTESLVLPQSTYSLIQGRALLQHGVQVLLSRILGIHWILSTKLVFQVKYNWWPERLGNILFRNNMDSLKYLYCTMYDFLLLFFNELSVCLYVLFYFNENYQTSMMRSRVTYFEWWIWETKDNPATGSIKHIFVQGFLCDQSQCHMFLLYSMVPFIFIYIAELFHVWSRHKQINSSLRVCEIKYILNILESNKLFRDEQINPE